MAKINDKTQAPVDMPALDFDKIEGARDSITRRPYIDWKKLAGRDHSNKNFVLAGFLIEGGIPLNNPKGAERKQDFHLGAIIELTHPCKAVVGEEIVDCKPGDEVVFSYGSGEGDLGRHLQPLFGHDVMFWVAIRPNGDMDLNNGNAPMKLYSMKVGEVGALAPKRRTGRYLLGGPTAKVAQVIEAPKGVSTQAKANASSQVDALES